MTKQKTNYRPVLVTGIPRSGISTTSAFLFWSGLYCGKVPHLRHPKKSTFENRELSNTIERIMLNQMSGLFAQSYNEIGFRLREQVLHQLKAQNYNPKKSPWFFKSHWLPFVRNSVMVAFPEAKWVIVHRDKGATIRANKCTGYTNFFNEQEHWEWWYDTQFDMLSTLECAIPKENVFVYRPSSVFEGDLEETKEMIEFVEGKWTSKLDSELKQLGASK
jgi:hypothetical protein